MTDRGSPERKLGSVGHRLPMMNRHATDQRLRAFIKPLRIPDDRGTPRPLFTDGSVNFHLKHRTEFKLGSPATLAVLLVLLVPMTAAALIDSIQVLVVVVPLLAIAMFYAASRVPRRQHAEAARDFLIAAGRCAGCGYGLRELPPDPDDCTPCPECGAAWKLMPARTGHL